MLLLGNWANFEALEETLSLPELEAIVAAARKKEERHHRFMAALKGIDLDAGEETAEDRVEQMKMDLAAKRLGVTTEALEFGQLGFDFEEG